jgi:hypothetical protein
MRKFIALIAVTALVMPLSLRGQLKREAGASRANARRSCALQGTWRLEGMLANGKPWPFDSPHLKIVNATHFAVVAQLSDSVRSEADSTKKVPRLGSLTWADAGTYTLDGDDYVEHAEVIAERQAVGTDLHAKCEVIGKLWYDRFTIPGTTVRIEEHYRRISP